MAIMIRDQHLEEQIDEERIRRGDAAMAKTACDLLREYLTQRQERERQQPTHQQHTAPAA